ncbi:MAG: nucleoside triphosphate pyrophosphohydrolase, partial [Bryobacteraceae bacterium]
EMAREEGLFTIADALDAINQKLIRRHPHVFAGASAETPEDVKQRWDQIKKEEKGGAQPASVLDAVPHNLPALMEAEKIGRKAAGIGFEWENVSGVLDKLAEEAAEVAEARDSEDREHVEHELGDLLFTVVNLARFLKVDPEQALRKTNARFRRRFAHVEQGIENSTDAPLERMEELWQEAKRLER